MGRDMYTLALLGDTSFGENYQAEYAAAGRENVLLTRGYEHTLARFRSFLAQQDLVIANLETPLTDLQVSPLHGRKQYVHWSDLAKAPAAFREHNVRAFSLANNHTLDYGTEGLRQTLDVLRGNDLRYFGAGLDATEAGAPLLQSIQVEDRRVNIAVFGAFEVRRRYLFEYSFYAGDATPGVAPLRIPDLPERIAALKAADPASYVVVFPHWGQNYVWRTQKQVRLAHALVDAGANLIVGHGAHMFGEIERYNGAWIVYSLGNFVFNSEGDYGRPGAHPFSLVASLRFSSGPGGLARSLRLYPILSDNDATGYQPRFVTASEFDQSMALIIERSPDGNQLRQAIPTATDEHGAYMELDLGLSR